jgi:hypothetical protein
VLRRVSPPSPVGPSFARNPRTRASGSAANDRVDAEVHCAHRSLPQCRPRGSAACAAACRRYRQPWLRPAARTISCSVAVPTSWNVHDGVGADAGSNERRVRFTERSEVIARAKRSLPRDPSTGPTPGQRSLPIGSSRWPAGPRRLSVAQARQKPLQTKMGSEPRQSSPEPVKTLENRWISPSCRPRFTRERSLVRNQPCPSRRPENRHLFVRLRQSYGPPGPPCGSRGPLTG